MRIRSTSKYQTRCSKVHSELRFVLAVAVLVLPVVCMSGCQKSLFPENKQRTQYDHYDINRGNFAPVDEFDPYGRPQPALRARLHRE